MLVQGISVVSEMPHAPVLDGPRGTREVCTSTGGVEVRCRMSIALGDGRVALISGFEG